MASAMSRAERVFVPLNIKCSMKCEIPFLDGISSREPARYQNPIATERTCGIASVTMRMPFGSTVRWYKRKDLRCHGFAGAPGAAHSSIRRPALAGAPRAAAAAAWLCQRLLPKGWPFPL